RREVFHCGQQKVGPDVLDPEPCQRFAQSGPAIRLLHVDQGVSSWRCTVASSTPAVLRLPSTQASRRPGPSVQGRPVNVQSVAPPPRPGDRWTPCGEVCAGGGNGGGVNGSRTVRRPPRTTFPPQCPRSLGPPPAGGPRQSWRVNTLGSSLV